MKNELTVLRLTIHRYRRLYGALGIFAGALIVLALVFGTHLSPAFAVPLGMFYMVLLIFTLGAFANPDSDLAGDAPALPTYLLRLPVSTRTLALPPLVASIVWPSLAWVVLAVGFLNPVGLDAPVLWPAGLLGTLGPALMAVQWAPLRSGKLRMMLGLLVPVLLIAIGLGVGATKDFHLYLTGLYALCALLFSRIAYRGLATSRISESTRVKKVRKIPAILQRKRVPERPFSSPLAAQRWLEWQRQGRILPILTATTAVLMSLPLLIERTVRPLDYGDPLSLSPNIWVWSAFPALLVIPLAFATVIGMGARPNDSRGADGAYHLFFATRPARSEILVRAKNQAGIMSVLVTWGIVLATAVLWSLTPSVLGGSEGPLWAHLIMAASWKQAELGVLVFALLVGWTWRNLTVGSFADFLPTRFGKRIYGSAVIVTTIVAATMLNLVNFDQWVRAPLSVLMEVMMVAALATKVGFAQELSRRLTRLRPAAKGDVRRVFGSWALGGGVAGVGIGILGNAWAQEINIRGIYDSPVAAVLAGLLLMPLGRSIASRLALEVGRHSVGEPGVVARWKTRLRDRQSRSKTAEISSPLVENLAAARPMPVETLMEERVVGAE